MSNKKLTAPHAYYSFFYIPYVYLFFAWFIIMGSGSSRVGRRPCLDFLQVSRVLWVRGGRKVDCFALDWIVLESTGAQNSRWIFEWPFALIVQRPMSNGHWPMPDLCQVKDTLFSHSIRFVSFRFRFRFRFCRRFYRRFRVSCRVGVGFSNVLFSYRYFF